MSGSNKETQILIAYEDFEPEDFSRPEKNLLLAVLLTAMTDLKVAGDSRHRAIEYFLHPEDDYIFSFRGVCNHLQVDPVRILRFTGLLGRFQSEEKERREKARRLTSEKAELQ